MHFATQKVIRVEAAGVGDSWRNPVSGVPFMPLYPAWLSLNNLINRGDRSMRRA